MIIIKNYFYTLFISAAEAWDEAMEGVLFRFKSILV